MAPAILFLIVFLTIIVWRLVFTGLHRPLLRETAAPEQEHNNIVEQGLHIFGQNDSDGGNCNAGEQPAETYLHRIVALTGATQRGSYYVLHVGKARFHVRDRNVKRIPDGADPTWARWETCFHPAHQDMAIPHTKTWRRRSKLLPCFCSSKIIHGYLIAGPSSASCHLRPTARCSTAQSDWARDENAKQMHTSSAGSQIPGAHCCAHRSQARS